MGGHPVDDPEPVAKPDKFTMPEAYSAPGWYPPGSEPEPYVQRVIEEVPDTIREIKIIPLLRGVFAVRLIDDRLVTHRLPGAFRSFKINGDGTMEWEQDTE